MRGNSAFLGLHPQCVHLAEPSLTLPLEVISDYFFYDFPQFNCLFSNRIAKFLNQIANPIAAFQIKSLHFKSNRQGGSYRDLNPNRDWHLPITTASKT